MGIGIATNCSRFVNEIARLSLLAKTLNLQSRAESVGYA